MPSTPEKDYSPTVWGSNEEEYDLRVPSGQLCRCRRIGVRDLMALGMVNSADPLSGLVDQKHIKRVKKTGPNSPETQELNVQSLMGDTKALLSILDMAEKLAVVMVIEPSLKRPIRTVDNIEVPLTTREREPGQVYTDQIDPEDLMFLFKTAIGGTKDLEQFPEQSPNNSGSVVARKAPRKKAK